MIQNIFQYDNMHNRVELNMPEILLVKEFSELVKCERYYQIRSNSYTIETNAIDRPIPMRVNGTIGTTTINGTTYKYADAEI